MTDEDRLAAILPIRLPKLDVDLRILLVEEAWPFKREVSKVVQRLGVPDVEFLMTQGGAAALAGLEMLNLCRVYDLDHALPEALGEHLTDAQLTALTQTLLAETYPFVQDIRQVSAMILTMLAEEELAVATAQAAKSGNGASPGPKSTNGRRATGIPRRATSRRAGPTGSSTSSGAGRKPAGSAKGSNSRSS